MRTTKILVVSLVLAVLTVAAQAQQGPGMTPGSSRIGQSAASASDKLNEDSKALKANEKAYNSALKNLPDKRYDPWRGVR
jgi:hypothetical protein